MNFFCNCNRLLNTSDIKANDWYNESNYSPSSAIIFKDLLCYLLKQHLYPLAADAIWSSRHISVTRCQETDLQCELSNWISSDLHSVAATAGIIKGN